LPERNDGNTPQNYLEHLLPKFRDFADNNPDWRGGPPATVENVQGKVPTEISTYIDARLKEFYKLTEQALTSADDLTEPWLRSLTRAPYSGKTQIRDLPNVGPEQLFTVTAPPLRYIEFQNLLLISHNNEIHKFPTSLAPILERLCSEPTNFSIPEIMSLQQKAKGLPPNEAIHYLQILYKFRVISLA
jgi:hypothetical protein